MKRLLLLFGLLTCLLAPASLAHAATDYDPFSQACTAQGGAGSSSSACTPTSGDPISGKNGALRNATKIIAVIAGVAAVIIIIISGFEYITSGGDPQKAASARSALIGAVIGLVIIVAAQAIIVFVLSKV